jgi:hypothetical protein
MLYIIVALFRDDGKHTCAVGRGQAAERFA